MFAVAHLIGRGNASGFASVALKRSNKCAIGNQFDAWTFSHSYGMNVDSILCQINWRDLMIIWMATTIDSLRNLSLLFPRWHWRWSTRKTYKLVLICRELVRVDDERSVADEWSVDDGRSVRRAQLALYAQLWQRERLVLISRRQLGSHECHQLCSRRFWLNHQARRASIVPSRRHRRVSHFDAWCLRCGDRPLHNWNFIENSLNEFLLPINFVKQLTCMTDDRNNHWLAGGIREGPRHMTQQMQRTQTTLMPF